MSDTMNQNAGNQKPANQNKGNQKPVDQNKGNQKPADQGQILQNKEENPPVERRRVQIEGEGVEHVIIFDHVSKIYKLKSKSKKDEGKRFMALNDISFKIPKGCCVGILGTNGSGKSTMSSLLAQISEPEIGTVKVVGEQALIAINLGLNGQLSGEENIELKGALLGLNKKQVEELKERVIEFSEIGDFLYQPVKTYSSGMKSRLGFSVNLALDPDIFIIDEALSVGDRGFARKCMARMNMLKEEGKTIVFISHSLPQVKNFCDLALWIEGGKLMEYGDIDTVTDHYSEYVEKMHAMTQKDKRAMLNAKFQSRILPAPPKKKLFGFLRRSK